MFLRPPSRLLFAFSKTPAATRCLHRITLAPSRHRVTQTRSFNTPAVQVAERFGVSLSSRNLHANHRKTLFLVFPNSALPQSTYDKLAESAMEELLDELQNILDSHGDSSLEVEYIVRPTRTRILRICPLIIPLL